MREESSATGHVKETEGPRARAARRHRFLRLAAENAALGAAYIVAANVGLRLAFANHNVTVVWPPTGVALAVLFLRGRRLWPGVWAGALIANLLNGAWAPVAFGISVGNTLAPMIGAELLWRGRLSPKLQRPGDVFRLLSVGAFLSMLVSATLGSATLALAGELGHGGFAFTWFAWWAGDALGVVTVAPLVLTFASTSPNPLRRRPLEAAVMLAVIGVGSWLIFTSGLPLIYLTALLVTVAAARFEQPGAAAAAVIASGVAVWTTVHGHLLVPHQSITANLLLLQVFNSTITVGGLTLAAVLSARARAEERFRLIFEGAPVPMLMSDARGRFQLVNSRAEALLGYAREELIGRSADMLVPDSYEEIWSQLSDDFSVNPQPTSMGEGPDFFVRRRDGKVVPIEMALNPIETEQGPAILASIVDASEHKRARERIRLMIDAAPNAMFMVDEKDHIRHVNAQAVALTGYTRAELIGQSAEILVPDRYRTNFERAAASYKAHPGLRPLGTTHGRVMRRKDGTEVPIDLGLNRFQTDEGAFVMVSVVDVSERYRAEERFRLMVEAAPIPTLIVDSDGRIELVNAPLEAMLGYTRAELVGKLVDVLVPEATRSLHPAQRASFLGHPTVRPMGEGRDLYARRKDGTEVPVEIGLNPVQTERGLAVVASVIDITERRQADRLRAEKLVAEEAGMAKSAFIANMSHEIRTPMNAVIGLTELVLAADLDARQRGYVELIQSSGQHLLRLIDDILEFSKIEAQGVDIEQVSFDVTAMIKSVLELGALETPDKDIELSSHIEDAVPRYLVGDPLRLRQVLANLLSNALKFTERGRVEIGAERKDTDGGLAVVRFWVRDTGIGIDPKRLGDIFDAFSQVDTSLTRERGGTGLGLAICRRLVEAMNGEIWVESEPGKGSTFSFEIAAREGQPPARSGERLLTVSAPCKESVRSPLRLLLVEDNAVNQKVALAMLRNCGYDADVAGDGVEALTRIESNHYDAVLMDVQMPRLDGLAATREICRRWPAGDRPRIIGMTAYVLSGDAEACFEAGMDDYVAKPVSTEKLIAVLANVRAAGPVEPSETAVGVQT